MKKIVYFTSIIITLSAIFFYYYLWFTPANILNESIIPIFMPIFLFLANLGLSIYLLILKKKNKITIVMIIVHLLILVYPIVETIIFFILALKAVEYGF